MLDTAVKKYYIGIGGKPRKYVVKQERYPIIQLDENGLIHVKCPKADFIRSLGWIDNVFSDVQLDLHEICERSSYIRGQKLYFMTQYNMHSVIVIASYSVY